MGQETGLTASFGVGNLVETDAVDAGIQQADKALYRSKSEGRNRVHLA
jgi:PleD family two-component response regulator